MQFIATYMYALTPGPVNFSRLLLETPQSKHILSTTPLENCREHIKQIDTIEPKTTTHTTTKQSSGFNPMPHLIITFHTIFTQLRVIWVPF